MDGSGSRRTTLFTAALAMFLLGAIYAYGVLLPAMMLTFHWPHSTAALPQSVLLFVYAVGMSLGGLLQDRLNPRYIAMTGGLLFGLGLAFAGYAAGLTLLVLSYGVLGGIGFGFAYVTAVTAAMRSYPRRRGLAAGLVVGAFGLGTFVWAPLAQHLLPNLGWQRVMMQFGMLVIVALPILGSFIRAPWHPHDVPGAHPAASGVSLSTAVRSGLFWIVFAAYTLVTAVGLMLLAYLVGVGVAAGMSPLQAAFLLSVTAIGSGVGRFLMGWLSDHIGRFPALIGATVLEVVVLLLLSAGVTPSMLYYLAGLNGFAFGTWLSLYGPIATDLFGLKSAGAIYGALYLSYGIGGVLGPMLGGWLRDLSGSYRLPFLGGALFCLLAAILFYTATRLHPPHYTHPPALEEEYPV